MQTSTGGRAIAKAAPAKRMGGRCGNVHGGVTIGKHKVKCESPKGHSGKHFNSFAMRSW